MIPGYRRMMDSAQAAAPVREGPLVVAELRDDPLSVDECLAAVALPEAGGTALFVGTVRDHDDGRGVVELEYVAHPLASRDLVAVAREVALRVGQVGDVAGEPGHATGHGQSDRDGRPEGQHPSPGDGATGRGALAVAVLHRTGRLAIGDIAVVAAASAAHRAEAFTACRLLIDEVKTRVPIWKRQFFTDGTAEWVGACISGHLG
jgi:molybdopterin synthase catalytic subunit